MTPQMMAHHSPLTLEMILSLRTQCGETLLDASARQELEYALAMGTYLTAWSHDCLTGFLSYKRIQHGAIWVSYCLADSSDAFWHLMKQSRFIQATRIHFHRRKRGQWTTRRWHA